MRSIYYIIWTMLTLLGFYLASCHKTPQITQTTSIVGSSPVNGQVICQKPTFNWTGAIRGQEVLYITAIDLNLGSQLFSDSLPVTGNAYVWDTVLPGGCMFIWKIKSGNFISQPDTFSTCYPDSVLIGNYSGKVYQTYVVNGAPPHDTVIPLGNTTFTITAASPGSLMLSDNLTSQQFTVNYSATVCSEMQNPYIYGDILSSKIIYTGNDSVYAFNGSVSPTGRNGVYWNAKRTH